MNIKKQKENFRWVKVEVLNEDVDGHYQNTGHFKLYRDFQWKEMVLENIKHLRYIEHCHFHHIENPKLEVII